MTTLLKAVFMVMVVISGISLASDVMEFKNSYASTSYYKINIE